MRTMYEDVVSFNPEKAIGNLYRLNGLDANFITGFFKPLCPDFLPSLDSYNLTKGIEQTFKINTESTNNYNKIDYKELTQDEANVLAFYELEQSRLEKKASGPKKEVKLLDGPIGFVAAGEGIDVP